MGLLIRNCFRVAWELIVARKTRAKYPVSLIFFSVKIKTEAASKTIIRLSNLNIYSTMSAIFLSLNTPSTHSLAVEQVFFLECHFRGWPSGFSRGKLCVTRDVIRTWFKKQTSVFFSNRVLFLTFISLISYNFFLIYHVIQPSSLKYLC